MKKLLAIVLALTLVLSLSVTAWAAPSPERSDSSSDDLPAQSVEVAGAVATAKGEEAETEIVANEDLTEEQLAAVEEAIDAVKAEGYVPVDTFYVESEDTATVAINLADDAVVFVVYPDGTVVKLELKDLVKVSEGRYEIPVDGACTIVIAKEA